MARFIQLPSRKTINLDAVLWIDCPDRARALKVIFYGHSELLIRDESDKEMLLSILGLHGDEPSYGHAHAAEPLLSRRSDMEVV